MGVLQNKIDFEGIIINRARLPDVIGAAVLCLLAGGTLAICFL